MRYVASAPIAVGMGFEPEDTEKVLDVPSWWTWRVVSSGRVIHVFQT